MRKAFSLLEIVLVLVLIGIVAALAVPAINAAFATYEVRQAANRVRARLAEARSRAVQWGVPYGFVAQLNGTRHGFAACQSLADFDNQAVQDPYDVHLYDLEESFRFVPDPAPEVEGVLDESLRQILTPESSLLLEYGSPWLLDVLRATGLPSEGTVAIIFFPDGSSTGGAFAVAGPSGLAARVSVDSLTGVARVDDELLRLEEGTPATPRLPAFDRRVQ